MLKVIKFLTVCVCSGPLIASAAGDTATITINGTVKANTCTLDNQTSAFNLPAVYTQDFGEKKGTVVSSVAVPISFSNCGTNLEYISVKISGNPDTADATAFKNTSSNNPASGVGIYLYDMDNTIFKPDGTKGAKIPAGNGMSNITASYTAKYISTDNVVTSGDFSTTITAVFTYN
jgi:type 1 fimbria pilin